MIKSFVGLLAMTFFVCLFIVILQFLWMHLNDLVGKGLPISVLAEFFFYASLVMVPLALPLAILIASLMTFGNLGERLELLAMKSAGISLFRIMRSLIVFISFIVVGAFFFSNNVIPVAQKKMWTLMFSIRQASPELDIPVGEFYSGIRGMNIYVRSKNHKTQALNDVMIYDFTNGFTNASVTTADSVHLKMTEDKCNLVLQIYNGEHFENLKKAQLGGTSSSVPYRRESFARKDILINFDANFKKMDESLLEDQHVSKNITQLTHDIDSVNHRRDSMCSDFVKRTQTEKYFTRAALEMAPTTAQAATHEKPTKSGEELFLTATQKQQEQIARSAIQRAQAVKADAMFNRVTYDDSGSYSARHNIEWHQKFTLSLACLIFFFIGAPLGAIIGKGGLGMPAVISILLFIVYYIVNTTGVKMARDLVWPVWQGVWLSSLVMMPIGIFFTYKAATDSAIMKSDAYKVWWQNLKEWHKNTKAAGGVVKYYKSKRNNKVETL